MQPALTFPPTQIWALSRFLNLEKRGHQGSSYLELQNQDGFHSIRLWFTPLHLMPGCPYLQFTKGDSPLSTRRQGAHEDGQQEAQSLPSRDDLQLLGQNPKEGVSKCARRPMQTSGSPVASLPVPISVKSQEAEMFCYLMNLGENIE
jgi:hypothetical protein